MFSHSPKLQETSHSDMPYEIHLLVWRGRGQFRELIKVILAIHSMNVT